MSPQRYYLGLDGGGTKTAALILDENGAECGRGTGGPGNVANSDDATLTASVRSATESACRAAGLSPLATGFAAVCAGVAGYSVEPRRHAFIALLQQTVRVEEASSQNALAYRVEPDYVIAYWGATHGEPGIVVIAGTGAVVFGRNAEGETHREDGLGFLLGDRGSGFNLGLRALRYTLAQMQAGNSDALSQAILKATGAQSQNEVIYWLYSGFSPMRVAALSPIVGELAEAGDPVARAHVAEMARRLRHSVRQTRHKLWMPRDTPVYPLGGLWQLGEFFRSEFAEPHWLGTDEAPVDKESGMGGRFTLALPKHDAAYGAALLAKDAAQQGNAR